ncbi:prolipoprotein diacylglyceryl transferase [Eubacteriales bacterium mix99]|jgi:prolipoprotein diacylglyceryl transferase
MNPVAFSIFGQPIYWYGILISAGVLIGIFLAMHHAKIFGMDQDSIVDMALLAIPMAIIGARLYYVIFEWDQYKGHPLDIFNIRKGGLAIYGGVLGGVLGGYLFSRWKKIDFWNLTDICAPSIILGQAIGRWGNYINQEAYGVVVNNPQWQWFPAAVFIQADQQWHMATFFYESFWNLIVFFILMGYRRHRKRTGEVFLLYLILYSLGRIFIEGLRTDSLYLDNVRISQLLGILLVVLGIVLFVYRRKHPPVANVSMENADRTGDSTLSSQDAAEIPESSTQEKAEKAESDSDDTAANQEESGGFHPGES